MDASTAGRDPRVARSRTKVLEAVTDLLRERGAAGVTVEAVVGRSGVARSTIYRHWATRSDLVAAAMASLLPVVDAVGAPGATQPADRAAPSGREGLRRELEAALLPLAGAPDAASPVGLVPLLLVEADRDPELAGVRGLLLERLTAPVRQVLERAVAHGVLPADLSTGDAVAGLLGPLVLQRFLVPGGADEGFVSRTVDAFLRAHPA